MLIPRNILTILSLCFANIRPPDFVTSAISRLFLCSTGLLKFLSLLILFAFVSGNELSAQTTFTKSIVTSSDDAEEEGVGGTYHGPGAVYTTGIYLELVNDFQSGGLGIQTVGMRYTSVTIPKNAIISNAYFTFRCMTPDVNNDNSSTCNLTIKGQAADNPSTFVGSSTPTYSISTRPTTTASVAWSPAAWTPGNDYTSANITTIVQELVNRSGWVSNNSMVFIITGSGTRTSQSYDDAGTNQPILTVTYTPFNLSTAVTNVNCPGGVTGAINLSITGGNSPFTYVWDNGATTQDLSGLEAGVYSVTVTDALGNKVSTSATVTEPTITTQPLTSQSLCNGGSPSTLSVVLSGGGSINYQWYSNTVNSTVGGTLIGGATSSGYTPPGNVVGTVYYYCGITKSGCTTIYSNTATVNVLADPNITSQPVGATICIGGTFAPDVSATGGTPSLVYQWQYSNNGSSWANVTNGTPANSVYSNSNSATLFTVSGNIAAGTYYYRCAISATGSGCDAVNSNNAVLIIVADPTITLQPVAYTACVGSFYAPTINATGGTPALNYQWQYSTNGSSGWANVSDGIPANATYIGANTSNVFEVDGNISAGTYYYRCAVTATGSGCDAVYSTNGVYTIAADPAITAQPASATICFGGTFAPDVTATGGTPSLTYQWQYSADGSTGWADVANGVPANSIYTSPTNPTAFTVTGNIATGTYYYRCKVMASGTECDPITSNNAVLTIVSDPSITSHPGNATICVNGSYNPTVTASGGAPSLVYQWQYSANGSTGWANVAAGTPANAVYSNSTSASLFTVSGSIAAGTYYYRCTVSATGSGCDAVNSNNGILTIVADPAISVQPSNATVCSGGTYSPTITATGGTPSLTYQWQYSANGSTGWIDVADGTPANATYSNPTSSNTFSVSGNIAAGTYYYHCIASASGSGCGSVTSNNGVLTVVTDPTITAQPASATICLGGTYAPDVTATGGAPSLTYQWQYSTDGSSGWANVLNGIPTNAVYTSPTSATAFLVSGTIAVGTYYYRCLVSSSGSGCDQTISNTGILTIVSTPVITSQPTDGTICLGGSFNPTISAIGGTPTYQWQYSITGLALWSNVTNGVPLNATYTNTTSPTLFTVTGNIIAGNYYYRCIVSSSGCSAATSNTATLTIVADPAVSVQPVSASICVGGTYNPTVTATGGTPSLTYQWQYSTASGGPFANVVDGTPVNSVYTNATSATLFAVNGNIAAGSYYYRCVVSASGSGCGNATSSNGILTVVADPSITVQPLSPTICVGGTYAPTITAAGGTPSKTYQWQYSSDGSTGWANVTNGIPANSTYTNPTSATTFTVTGAIAAGTYYYRCAVSAAGSGCDPVYTNNGVLTIVADPNITAQPTNGTICVGGTYSPDVIAAGGTPSLTYQWQYSANGSSGWANVVNGTPANSTYVSATSPTLFTVSGNIAAGTYYYHCVISSTGSGCNSVTSNNGVLTVVSAPTISAQPVSGSICFGGSFNPTITALGGTPTYQWQYSANGTSGWANVTNSTPANAVYANATSATLFTVSGNIAVGNYYYRCIVTSSGCSSSTTSSAATLTIVADISISAQPSNATICSGGTYSPTITASGGTPSLTYQWQFSSDGTNNWNNVADGTPSNSTYTNPTSSTTFTVTGSIAAGTYYYRCIASASGSGCGSATSSTGILTVIADISISSQPANASICAGGTYAPTVTATGGTPSLAYQWQYSSDGSTGWANVAAGTPANAVYSNPTSSSLFTVSGNIASGSYYYRCIVSASGNGCGSVTSNNGVLTIVADPSITGQPASASICYGGTYSPTVTATGGTPSLAYQWQYSADGSTGWNPVTNGTPLNATYTNATSASLFTVTGNIAAGSYYYRCAITASGSGCDAVNSNVGTLTIIADPAITAQPVSASICVGGTYAPTVTATGGTPSLAYQWQYSADGSTGWANVVNSTPANAVYSGASTSGSFTVTGSIAAGSYYYRCAITASGNGCDAVNSNTGVLTIIADPAITVQPSNASICVGGTYAPTITATGGTPSLAYQWQYSADGSTGWANVVNSTPANAVYSNATSASLFTVTGSIAAGTYYYRCAVTSSGSGCDAINSNNGVLTVISDPAISTQPVNASICVGGTYNATVVATGGTPSLSYQWQFSTDGSTNWNPVSNGAPANSTYSGNTTASLTVSGNIGAGNYYYRCVISSSGSGCDPITSNTGILTVTATSSVTSQPASASICVGGTYAPTVTATGGTPSLTYQWQYSADGSTGWANVVNSTPANAVYSNATSASLFTVTGSIASGSYYYRCVVSASGVGCGSVNSNTGVLTIIADPAITVQPANASICVGGTYAPTVTATGGTPSLAYQWQYSVNGSTGWANVVNSTPANAVYSNATSASLFTVTGSIAAGTYYYRCAVTASGSGCDAINSNNGVLTVVADPAITAQPSNASICVGGTYAPTVTATGGTPSLAYQWQFSTDGTNNWNSVVNGTPANAIYANATSSTTFTVTGNIGAGTYYYRCAVTASGSGCDAINSNTGILTVIADPAITAQPSNASICVGGTYAPTVTATGGTPSLGYQWQYSSDGSTGWGNVVNGVPVNSTYTNPTSASTFTVTGSIAAGTYYYRCAVTSSGSGCDAVNSNNGVLTVISDPAISTQPSNASICVGGTYNATVVATGGTPSLSYQWQFSTDGSTNWNPVSNGAPANSTYSGNTTSSLTVSGNIGAGNYYYRCVISSSGSGCDPMTSNTGILTVTATPSVTSQPASASICVGGTYAPTVTATGGTPSLTYQWQYSSDGSTGWSNVTNGIPANSTYTNPTSASTFTVTGSIAAGSYYYRCVVSASGVGCGSVNSNTGVLTVVADPAITVHPVNASICVGGTYAPTITATGGTPSLAYQWQYSVNGSTGWANVVNSTPANAVYSNATSASLFTVTGSIAAGTYYYRCAVTASGSGCDAINSNNGVLTVVADPAITAQPSNASICVGGTYAPTVMATGGTPSLGYQWQFSTDGTNNWNNVVNGTPANAIYANVTSSTTFTVTGNIGAGTYYYRCSVTASGSGCDAINSNTGMLTVIADPAITAQPANASICIGGTYAPTVTATGGTPSLAYQWQYSADGSTGWANVVNSTPANAVYSNATSASLFTVTGSIAAGTYYYRCAISSSGGGCDAINSNTGVLTIVADPSITGQPASASICYGGTYSPTVTATGGTPSLSYQWQFSTDGLTNWNPVANGTPLNATYTNATSASLFTVTGNIAAGSYYYRCAVTASGSGCDAVNSNVGTLTIIADPAITAQPVSASICVGGTYAPTVTATGGTPSLVYQWQYSANGSNGWANVTNNTPANASYSGATTSGSFTVSGSIAAGSYYYRCVISSTGVGCDAVNSNNGVLTVIADPAISAQPANASICVGGTYAPTVTATGGTPSLGYQWQYSSDGSTGWGNVVNGVPVNSTYTNPTSASTFTVTGSIAAGTYYYRCAVTSSGSGCDAVNSNNGVLTVISDPAISTQPSNASICVGGTYNATVVATGGTPSLSYQWQFSTDGSTNWNPVSNGVPANSIYSGNTTSSLTVSGNIGAGNYYYRCVISSSGSGCDPITSSTGILTVTATPSVTLQPASASICVGGTYAPTVTATGGTPSLTYQWQFSTDGSTGWSNVTNGIPANASYSNATSASLFTVTGNIAAGSYYYRCLIAASGSGCGNVASNNAILTIIADPNITSQPSSANICLGGVYSPTITASGGTPSLTYQWQYSADGSTGWSNVTNGIPANSSYSGVTSASSFIISGNIAAGTYYYRCAVSSSGSGCNPVYSNNAILTVVADPSISIQPSGSTICYGGNFNPTISATGGTPSLTYQWQLSLDGLTGWANVLNGIPANAIYSGALTASSFNVIGNIPTGTYYYRCVVSASGSGCNAINSVSASLTILNQPSISSQPVSSQSICLNGIPSDLNISVTGGTGSFSYQWYSNTINSNSGGTLINGETNTVYTPPTNSIGTVYYYCIISQTGSGCGPITSNVAAVTVVDIPMITNQPLSDAICIGGTYAPSVTATGGTPALSYKWQYSTNGTNGWTDVVNGIPANAVYTGESTSNSFTINGSIATGIYYYRCVIAASGSGCNTIYSNNAILTIHSQPTFTTQPIVSQSVCVNGSPTDISVSISGGAGTVNYQWYSNTINSNSGGTLIIGATASSYSPPTSVAGTSYYYCKVSNSGSGCGDIFSNTAEIIVISSPTIITQPISESICTGGFYAPYLTATGGTPSLSYQWQYSVNGTSGWSNVTNGLPTNADYSGATTANAFIISGNISTGTYYYRCIVSASGSGCIDAISNTVSLTIVAQPTVSAQPLITQTICQDGLPTDLTVSATGGAGSFTYQWYSNIVNTNSGGSLIIGATNDSYTPLTNTLGTVYYYCEISQSGSACGPIYSNPAEVNVIISPSITMQPDSATICRGGTYNPMISATGGTPSLTYQWQYSSDGINGWANVANGTPANSSYAGSTTASSFIVSGNLVAGIYYYQCIVSASGSGCSSITSNPAVLTVVADPAIVSQPVSATICYSGTYSPTVVASGGTPSLTYQWQFSPNTTSSNFANVVDGVPAGAIYSGANTPDDFHVMGDIAVGSAYYYRCLISSSGSGCGTVISGNGRMTIVADIAVTAQPASATICKGGSSFAPNVTATGGTPTKLYQWQYSPDGVTGWTDLVNDIPSGATYSGATTATGLSVGGLKNIPGIYYYRCAIFANGSGCDTTYSDICIYTVVDDPYLISGPTLDTICVGGIYAPVVVGGGGTPSLNYNWQRSANGTSSWGNVTNNIPANAIYSGQNTSSSFMVTGDIAPGTYYYRCRISASGSGCTTFSGPAATLKIIAQPTITAQPIDSQIICYNATPTNLDISSSGGNGTFSYQWYANTINSNSGGTSLGALNGANTSSFIPPTNIDGTFYYYCEISQTGTGCGPIYSNVATVIIEPEFLFNLSSQTDVDCYGNGNGSVTVSPTGGISPYTYNINGGTFQSSSTFSGLSGGTYTIIIKDNNNCTLSQDISITEPSAALSASITDTTNVLCNGDATGGAIASSSGGTSPYTYVWSNGNLTFDLTNVVAGTYTVTVTDAHNCTTSISVPITEADVVGVNITQDVSWYMISAPAPGINYGDFLNGFATQGYPGSSYPDKQPNLIWFDETDTLTTNISWRTIGNSSQVMTPGRGYYFFVFGTVPGDPLYDVVLPKQLYVNNCIVYAQPFSYTNATFPITFTPRNGGKVSNGPNDTVFIETNLADQGWNLLGNPTGKSLDWNASGWTKTNMDNSIYVWDPVDKEFKVFNGVTGTHNGQISPFQSFWVRAHGPNPVLSFTDEVFSDGGVFLRGGDTTINIAHYSIPFKLGIDNLSANSFITFMDEGRDGPDKWDAFQIKPLSDTWLEVYTTASESQTVPLVINNLPFEGKDYYNLPLYVGGKKNQVPIKGDFKLEWEIPDNWPADWSVSLHDHLTQKVIPMRSQKNYVFNYQSENLLGNGQGHEKGLIHLPSSIVETITDKKSNEVRSGSAPFSVVIEKKKPVDPDYIASTTKLLRNYPNPFSSKTNIKFSLPQPGNITLELFDVNGRLLDVIADNVYYPGGINTIVWVNKSINNGIYLLRIKSETGNDVIKLNIIK